MICTRIVINKYTFNIRTQYRHSIPRHITSANEKKCKEKEINTIWITENQLIPGVQEGLQRKEANVGDTGGKYPRPIQKERKELPTAH